MINCNKTIAAHSTMTVQSYLYHVYDTYIMQIRQLLHTIFFYDTYGYRFSFEKGITWGRAVLALGYQNKFMDIGYLL